MDQARFIALWSRCCGQRDAADSVFSGIEASYGEAHRRYHTGAHIDHCLRQFDLARDDMEDADAIELALWFHDVEYDPDASDNELMSAERFRQAADGLMDGPFVEQVYRLILTTIHNGPPGMPDEKFVVDIDLSSFGLPWDEFTRDSRNVRREFPKVNDQDFAQKNSGFLQRLLNRSNVYSTDFFRQHLEARARENMQKQIVFLKRMGN
jgi:predicted metal-dependent HD superfamily phosphohydrolase